MPVKGYLALLVGVFVAALAVVTVTQRPPPPGGPPPESLAGSRSFTPQSQDAARYR
jgi:hypothetical protein